MAALTIDMGFVRLTQAQMQPAVEAAALEGLRFRDHLPEPWLADPVFLAAVTPECGSRPPLPQYLTDPVWVAWRERVRRWLARNQVALVYANKLTPGTDEPNLPVYGAGPLYALGVGIGPSNAMETISAGAPPVYHPHLELNFAIAGAGNAKNGDMVAGTFGVNPSYPPGELSDENKDYDRRDFTPASPDEVNTALSFLVRLRRVNDFQAQAGLDSQPGVSSHGPQLPLLFGRESMISGSDPSTGYSTRYHGLTARAVAIADSRAVVSVGKPDTSPSLSLPGRVPFAIFRSRWSDLTLLPIDQTDTNSPSPNNPVTITLHGDGTLNIGGTRVGYFTSTDPSSLTSIGQLTSPLATDPTPTQLMNVLSDPGYVPIIEDPDSGTVLDGRIIGFGFLTVDRASITSTAFLVRKRTRTIAPVNATTVLMQPFPSLFSNPSNGANLQLLLTRWRGLGDALLAPTLAR